MTVDNSALGLWREAFVVSNRLSELDEGSCATELELLSRTCPELYQHVAKLIAGHGLAETEGPLTRELAGAVLAIGANVSNASPQAGTVLGSYTLERLLGEGGMGEVWLAHRTDGRYRGAVAVKMLHPHLARADVRERFVREGEIAARLSHPHIARLYDAGTAPEGLLYLVFEYVQGERIDFWCDAQRFDVAARVRLFLDVCEAVAQAHAHLIVHRDIKPSNILVTADGQVKLLDFGIAKLVEEQSLNGPQTELTRLGGRVLTPEYAAPEQVLGAAVTTVTDVYSLGVLLYVLLSGSRPYGGAQTTPAQLERDVVETDPKPLATVVGAITAVATNSASDDSSPLMRAERRNTTPAKLKKALRGDLETIVGKALKKAPAERYPSVLALSEDLRRHLNNQPVQARPDAFSYRAAKFVRRNRAGTAAAAVVLVAIAAGIGGVVWQAQIARAQAQRAERVKDFLVSMFDSADPEQLQKQDVSARALIDGSAARIESTLKGHPLDRAELYQSLTRIELSLGDARKSLQYANTSLELRRANLPAGDPLIGESLLAEATAAFKADAFNESETAARQAIELFSHASGDHRIEQAKALADLGWINNNRGSPDKAVAVFKQAVMLMKAAAGAQSPEALTLQVDYAGMLGYASHYAEAEREIRDALVGLKALYGINHSEVANAQVFLGSTLSATDRYAEAILALSAAVDIDRNVFGPHSLKLATALRIRTSTFLRARQFPEAIRDSEDALQILPQNSIDYANVEQLLGRALMGEGRYSEAARQLRSAIEIYRAVALDGYPELYKTRACLGAIELLSGNAGEAEKILKAALDDTVARVGTDSYQTTFALGLLVQTYGALGRPAEAVQTGNEVVAIASKLLGPDSIQVAVFEVELGQALMAQDESLNAHAVARLADHALPLLVGEYKQDRFQALMLAASAARINGSVAESTTRLQEAIALSRNEVLPKVESLAGPNSILLCHTRYGLAQALADAGDTQAGPLFDQVIETLSHLAPDDWILGNVLLDRARWRLSRGEEVGARQDLRAAIEAIRRNQGPDSIYLNKAELLLSQLH